jgi:hypothetical protein
MVAINVAMTRISITNIRRKNNINHRAQINKREKLIIMNSTLSDKEFFDNFSQSCEAMFEYLDDTVIVKDHEFKFKYASPAYFKLLNQDTPLSKGDIIGKDMISMKVRPNEELIKSMAKQDELVKQNRARQRFMHIDNHKAIYVVFKRPIINPATDNFLGIITNITTLAMPNLMKMLFKIHNTNNYIMSNDRNDNDLEYTLTEKQHIVLFLYLHRYSAAEISSLLGTLDYKMSNSRINDHLEALKFIFRVKTKDQLIEKALAMNYNLLIPRALLKEGCYSMNENVQIV